MVYIITDAYITYGACKPECSVDCIAEGTIYKIDENVCIDCGSCAGVCPTGTT